MLIGLTGGIGSGKSTIAAAIRAAGYPVYDSDAEAKRLIIENAKVRAAIVALLGEDVYEGNVYHTDRVAQRVFANPELLLSLNHIVHPAVAEDLKAWASNQAIAFVESAILYESGLDGMCDYVAGVLASKAIRLARTMQRDGVDEERVKARMKAQMTNCQLRARVDFVVENDGKHPVDKLVQSLLRKINNVKSKISNQ